MAFYYDSGIGTFHLNEVRPPRVVPGNERHKWDGKPGWGEQTTCLKCGCVKRRKRTQPDYTETYHMPGGVELAERPACVGGASITRNPS